MSDAPSTGTTSRGSRAGGHNAYLFAAMFFSLSLVACSSSPTDNEPATNFFHLDGQVRYADGLVPEAVVVNVLTRREPCDELSGPMSLDTGFLLEPVEASGVFDRNVEIIVTRWREEICIMLVAETKTGVHPAAGPDTISPINVVVSGQPPQDSITVTFVLKPRD